MHDHGRLASELPPLHRLALVETSIYAIAAESYGQQLFIERGRVRISRLSCTRKIVDVSSAIPLAAPISPRSSICAST